MFKPVFGRENSGYIHLPGANTYTGKIFLGNDRKALVRELILEEVNALSHLDLRFMG